MREETEALWRGWATKLPTQNDIDSALQLLRIVRDWSLPDAQARRLLDLTQHTLATYRMEQSFLLYGSRKSEKAAVQAIGRQSAKLADLIKGIRPTVGNLFGYLAPSEPPPPTPGKTIGTPKLPAPITLNLVHLARELEAVAVTAESVALALRTKSGPQENVALDRALAELLPDLEAITGFSLHRTNEPGPHLTGALSEFVETFFRLAEPNLSGSTLPTALGKFDAQRKADARKQTALKWREISS